MCSCSLRPGLKCQLLALFTLVSCVRSDELFSSLTGLESLLRTEQLLRHDLRAYVASTKLHVATLESELQKIEEEHATAAADVESYLTNPVNAYRLIKRLQTDWRLHEDRIRQTDTRQYFLARMAAHRETLNFPTQVDAVGAASALVRLQETYQLDVAQVAAGIINGIKYGNAMSWQDCLILGQQLFAMAEYNHTKIWLKESMQRLSQEKYATEPTSLDFMEGVAESLYHLGDLSTALNLSNQVLHVDPARVKAWGIKGTTQMVMENMNLQPPGLTTKLASYHETEEYQVYKQICRGQITATATQLRPLRCRYVTNNVPYRLLAPFKVEEHHLDPLVLTFHDIISDNKINTLTQMASPHIQRSTVRSQAAHSSVTSLYRTSKHTWLPYDTHKYMVDMLRDLHDVTGLDTTYCEQLQVANYILGGHYEPHWDFYTTEAQIPDGQGNRIATAIFYFSDVEQGGATAFPYLGIAVKPQKGNVLFWYNLHRSLDRDFRTKHAGCPVLKGSKWIANVWIRELTQTFARPCALHRDDEISRQYAVIK